MAPTAAGQAWSPPPPRPPRPRSRPRAPALPPPPRAASGRGRGAATATDPLPRAAPHAARPGASRLEGPLSAGFGDGPRSGGFQRSAFSVQWTLDGIARRLQLRSGIQRIFIETLRMNQGLYLSKLGGLLFSLSLKQLRTGSDPSWAPFLCCRGSGAGFQRKSWAPGGPPGPSAQPISGSCRCGAGGLTSEDPGSGLGHRPPERPLLPPRRAFPQLLPRLYREMPGTLSLGIFEERRVHVRRRRGFLLQVRLRAQQDRREPLGAPQSPCSIRFSSAAGTIPGRAGTVGTGQEGACRRPLLLTFWKAAGSFSFFSTTLLFLMIVHNRCICFPCSSSKGVSL